MTRTTEYVTRVARLDSEGQVYTEELRKPVKVPTRADLLAATISEYEGYLFHTRRNGPGVAGRVGLERHLAHEAKLVIILDALGRLEPTENAEPPGFIHTESPCQNEHERPVDE